MRLSSGNYAEIANYFLDSAERCVLAAERLGLRHTLEVLSRERDAPAAAATRECAPDALAVDPEPVVLAVVPEPEAPAVEAEASRRQHELLISERELVISEQAAPEQTIVASVQAMVVSWWGGSIIRTATSTGVLFSMWFLYFRVIHTRLSDDSDQQ